MEQHRGNTTKGGSALHAMSSSLSLCEAHQRGAHSSSNVPSQLRPCQVAYLQSHHSSPWQPLWDLQEGLGPWLLQGIEVLDKASDAVFYFPCLQWLDTAGKAKTKLVLGSRPPAPAQDPQPLAKVASEVPVEEEVWQAAVSQDANAAETNDTGLGGCYTVGQCSEQSYNVM